MFRSLSWVVTSLVLAIWRLGGGWPGKRRAALQPLAVSPAVSAIADGLSLEWRADAA